MNLRKFGILLLGIAFIGSVMTLLLSVIWRHEAVATWAFTSMVSAAAAAGLWAFIESVVRYK